MSDTANLLRLMAGSFMMPQRNKDLLKKAARELDAIAAPIRVKPLVWDDKTAITPFPFSYVLSSSRDKGEWIVTCTSHSSNFRPVHIETLRQFENINKAKAAAQRDYEDHIMSALEPSRLILAALEGGTR